MTVADERFEDLFEREYPRLVRALRRADDDDAADAVQEAFVQAFVRWHRVGRLDDPAGWVRRAAVNRLLNARRSRTRRDSAVARLAAPGIGHVAAFDSETRLDTQSAVRNLPPQQRVAVALFYGGDLSTLEVADAMKLSEGTVKAHLHSARDRLREALKESSCG
jgi:RNA polymerase sigma factor (sigma-70 family)